MVRRTALVACLLAVVAGPAVQAADTGSKGNTTSRTKTQTWHKGETVIPGQRGSDGRTTGLTGKNIPPGLPGAGPGGCPVGPALNIDQIFNNVLNCLMQPAIAEPLKGGTADKWDEWNNGVADAIYNEFQSHMIGFQDTYGPERVPLKITINYQVVGPPATRGCTYMGKKYTYCIEMAKPGWEAIPPGDYGLTSAGLNTVRQNFVNIAQQSMYAAMASYQSRLKFPCSWTAGPPQPGRYPKSAIFSNQSTGIEFSKTTTYRPC
jgi:hypothetical protein